MTGTAGTVASSSPSAAPSSASPSARSPAALDQAVAAVVERKDAFARLTVAERVALLRAVAPLLEQVAPEWVAAACRAKEIPFDQPVGGEEWLAGPATTARNVRLLIESLIEIGKHGRPRLGQRVRTREDGRVEVQVLPAGGLDGIVYQGLSCWVRLQPGIDQAGARAQQAAFYQQAAPVGRVALILGAGNVSSIPPMDVLYKMFVEGSVCVLKMNPVNEWVGPFLERALAPLIGPGYLRIVYGGGEEGAYLCNHPQIDDIHITGSDKTHDRIVFGPPGPEQDRRKHQGTPLLAKPITSELGNVSPVAIVPGRYTDKELGFQARSLVTMLVNNGSFNCNGAKVLITARGWPQRDRFLALFRQFLAAVHTRKAFYPGARQRYDDLTAGRDGVQYFGDADAESLRWAFIPGVDGFRAGERLFQVEAFCGLLAHTEIGEADPASFLDAVTSFCNDRLWGTLNAALVIDPRSERDPIIAAALDRAVTNLRYGTVAINLWPGVAYGTVSPPWGGHPSATLANIQSGLGWVHNTFMLGGIEKSILRAPTVLFPKPAWYFDNRLCHVIGRRLTTFETRPRPWTLAPLVWAALRG